MSDINNILSKHFHGEATPEEERQVKKYQHDHPKEYKALQAFWTKKGVQISKFETAPAWKKVVQKASPTKQVRLYPYIRRVASIAAVFLLAIVGYYYFNQPATPSALVHITAETQNQKIELADGSIVYLNKAASFSYTEKFSTNKREVTLDGEAFFEIAKDAHRPFIVHTNHCDVEVLGTSFNINTALQQTDVSVATGKVKVENLNTRKSSILVPQQAAKISPQSIEVYPTVNDNYQAWKTGVFHFEKTPIQQVVEDLNSFYGKKIILSKSDDDCLLNATFDQRDLKEIIEIIQTSCNLQLQQKNTKYELY